MSRSDAPGPDPAANDLLAALSADEMASLQPLLDLFTCPARTVLFEPNQVISHVYFPTAGMISLLAVPAGEDAIEAGVVGREGFAGLPVFLGTDRSTVTGVVQMPLRALRMSADDFRGVVSRPCALHDLLLRYTHYLLCQISQSLACGLSHSLDKRLCRWLLKVHDRARTDHFPLTQEFMANMLGVRRASVNAVASELQEQGLISYSRGRIRVLNRAGLEENSCDCFRVVESEWSRLFT